MVNEAKLTGWTPMAAGILFIVVGGLWTLQGLDIVGGSVMSGVSLWAIVGPVVAVIGLALVVIGVRRRNQHRRDLDNRVAESTPENSTPENTDR